MTEAAAKGEAVVEKEVVWMRIAVHYLTRDQI
jgi:hypothetical protein